SSQVRHARTPAYEVVPQGPAAISRSARRCAASLSAVSLTVTAASSPFLINGQASEEGVPQLRPDMIVCPVSTETGRPCARLGPMHAAESGSTETTAVAEPSTPWPELAAERR